VILYPEDTADRPSGTVRFQPQAAFSCVSVQVGPGQFRLDHRRLCYQQGQTFFWRCWVWEPVQSRPGQE
jgi:hypothetical protein